MKTLYKVIFGFLLLVAIAATQQQKQADTAVPAYSTAQEQAFSGTVLEVKDYQCPVSGTIGSHISVKGTSETLEVHLAPAKFLQQYSIVLKPGDKVTITGVKFTFDGKPAMLARLVAVSQDTFRFRDDRGRPEW